MRLKIGLSGNHPIYGNIVIGCDYLGDWYLVKFPSEKPLGNMVGQIIDIPENVCRKLSQSEIIEIIGKPIRL